MDASRQQWTASLRAKRSNPPPLAHDWQRRGTRRAHAARRGGHASLCPPYDVLASAPRNDMSPSREQPVHEPARGRRLARVEALAKQPEATAGVVLDQVVVAGRRAAAAA